MFGGLQYRLLQSDFPSFLIEGVKQDDRMSELAAILLCENKSASSSENTACGSCLSCKWVSRGNHPDWLKTSGHLKTEELRELLYEFRLRPARASLRILSITDFQEANASVQNALLKTLEEPLENRRILLGATHSKAVLPTIRSRCVRIPAESNEHVEMDEELLSIFRLVETNQALELHKKLEELLKNRDRAIEAIKKLSLHASQRNWPGAWRDLAPNIEVAREALDRNLNPKIVWDRLFDTLYEGRHEAH